jgi:hypothetical protein
LRHEALFKEAPQRDRQFARNLNDHDASDTTALPCSSLHKQAGERARSCNGSSASCRGPFISRPLLDAVARSPVPKSQHERDGGRCQRSEQCQMCKMDRSASDRNEA